MRVVLALIDLNRFPEDRRSKMWFAGLEQSDILVVALLRMWVA